MLLTVTHSEFSINEICPKLFVLKCSVKHAFLKSYCKKSNLIIL